jgi:hypothetical protein
METSQSIYLAMPAAHFAWLWASHAAQPTVSGGMPRCRAKSARFVMGGVSVAEQRVPTMAEAMPG